MGLRYRKRVKVAPGVYLNLSKSGVSTTLKAGKGVSVSMGENGTYLNTGIPGTGLYSRQKISGTTMKNMKRPVANPKHESNTGCWYSLWVLLVFVMIGVFIIGLIITDSMMIGLGFTGVVVFIICAFISHAIGKKGRSKKIIPVSKPEERNTQPLSTEPYKEISKEDNSSESVSEEKRTITEEMMQKLLTPFPMHVEETPSDRDPLYTQAKRLVVHTKQGFTWAYSFKENNQLNFVSSVNISTLKDKVLARGWQWIELTDEATRLVVTSQLASTSLIQRKLQMGYNKSAKIIDRLEESGIVGPYQSNSVRNVLVNSLEGFEELVKKYNTDFSKEPLFIADEIFSFCQQLEKEAGFVEELNRHNIKVTGSDGKPLCGEGGEVRSLFFLDIAHCYSEMADIIDLKRDDGIGILYLMFRLIEPVTPIPHDKQHIDVIKSTLPSGAESLINQIKGKPFFSDGDIDFTVAAILKRYNKDLLNKYLTLLFRYCSLIAKADGNITDKEQHFLDHIAQLRSNSMNSHEGVTVQKAPALSEKYDGIAELDGLIGLDSVKQEVRTMSNFIKVQLTRQQQGLKATQVSYHCVFTGNPGTGKTTVARILAGIYNELGVLKKGHLVETDRSGLVAEYVGQTAVKTNKVIDSALDGVLFIDEAYSLVTGSGNDYGNEAIATLLKRMEDNRDRLIVILAGYGNEMKQFIDSNPGLQSRFNRYIHFPDYNAGELLQIFARYAQKNDYDISEEAQEKLKSLLEDAVNNKDKNFGNGRFVRNLFEKTLERQANRLSGVERPTLSQLKEILPVDI